MLKDCENGKLQNEQNIPSPFSFCEFFLNPHQRADIPSSKPNQSENEAGNEVVQTNEGQKTSKNDQEHKEEKRESSKEGINADIQTVGNNKQMNKNDDSVEGDKKGERNGKENHGENGKETVNLKAKEKDPPKYKCGECNGNVTKSTGSVGCIKCGIWWHMKTECSRLAKGKKSDYEDTVNYICHKCEEKENRHGYDDVYKNIPSDGER